MMVLSLDGSHAADLIELIEEFLRKRALGWPMVLSYVNQQQQLERRRRKNMRIAFQLFNFAQ